MRNEKWLLIKQRVLAEKEMVSGGSHRQQCLYFSHSLVMQKYLSRTEAQSQALNEVQIYIYSFMWVYEAYTKLIDE